MNPEFSLSAFLPETTTAPERRTPAQTVTEYVLTYRKWARECHDRARDNRDRIAELQRGEARKVLTQIQALYCTSRNRQHQRASTGYYFLGGTYDAADEIETECFTTRSSAQVITMQVKNRHPSFRFTLRRKGGIWRIDSLEKQTGPDHWISDIL